MRMLFLIFLLLTINGYCDSESTVGGRTGADHIIQDEGTSLRPRPYLNFTGSAVTCSDSGGKTVCNVTGGSGSGGSPIAVKVNGSTVSASIDTLTFTSDFSGSESPTGTANISSNTWTRTSPYLYPKTISDNVGIGTSTASTKLKVGSTGQFGVDNSGNITTSGGYTQTGASANALTGTTTFAGGQVTINSNSSITANPGYLSIGPSLGESVNNFITSQSNGAYTLDVGCDTGSHCMRITNPDLATHLDFQFNAGSGATDTAITAYGNAANTLYKGIQLQNSGGTVSIGTASANNALTVFGVGTTGGETIGATTAAPANGLYVVGQVGIGSSSPNNALYVAGTAEMQAFKMNLNPSSGYVLTSNGVGVGTWMPAPSGSGSGTPASPSNSVQFNNGGSFGGSANFNTDGNNIGIGTASVNNNQLYIYGPGTSYSATMVLHNNSVNSHRYVVYSTYDGASFGPSKFGIYDGTAAVNRMTIDGTGNVGFGTTIPTDKLDIFASDSGITLTNPSAAMESNINSNTTNNNFSDYAFAQVNSSGAVVIDSKITGIHKSHTGAAESGDIAFLTLNAGTAGERVRINSAGNVGIGTSVVGALLEVDKNSIANATTDGIVVANNTPSLVGTQQQLSPRIRLVGQGWKTDVTTANQQTEWYMQNEPKAAATAPGNSFAFVPVRNSVTGAPVYLCQANTGSPKTGIFGLDGGSTAGSKNCNAGQSYTGFGEINASAVFGTYVNGGAINNFTTSGIGLGNNKFLQWFSGNAGNSAAGDTVISRTGAGNIGIGTSGVGTGIFSGRLTVTNIGIGTSLTATSALTVMSGNVGIGTWKPASVLQINGTTGLGWPIKSAANQACNTTCNGEGACVLGFDQGTLGVVLPSIVGCTDATADQCQCAGP